MGRIPKVQKKSALKGFNKLSARFLTVPLILTLTFSGCATYKSVKPDTEKVLLVPVRQGIPEAQLLDVRVQTFDPGKLPTSKNAARGLSPEIRQAEAHYIAVQIRKAVQQSGHWGVVRVVPKDAAGDELLVTGKILKSNGEVLQLAVSVRDASGRYWFKDKVFRGSVNEKMYKDALRNRLDAFGNLYNRIANELARYRAKTDPEHIKKIRQLAEMRFAADLSPDVFGDYIKDNKKKGSYKLERLPPVGDELFERVRRIRERDYLLVDTLDEHYELLHGDMQKMYMEWRKARLVEMNIIREIDRRKNKRIALGTGILVGSALLNALLNQDGTNDVITASTVTSAVTTTAKLLIEADKFKEEAKINKVAIEELGESFVVDVEPTVLRVEGEVIKLTGSAEEKYKQWREVIRELYQVETGIMIGPIQPEVTDDGKI